MNNSGIGSLTEEEFKEMHHIDDQDFFVIDRGKVTVRTAHGFAEMEFSGSLYSNGVYINRYENKDELDAQGAKILFSLEVRK